MGGRGSGRKSNRAARNTTDDYRMLDVRWLNREGVLVPGQIKTITWYCNKKAIGEIFVAAGLDAVVLSYRVREMSAEWKEHCYSVRLTATTGTKGGRRIWFLCPVQGCSRRVAVLYGGAIFACRHCHGLVYKSQYEDPLDRLRRRARKLRKHLGQPEEVRKALHFEKPKGMHWTTFADLRNEHRRSECLINQMFIDQGKRIMRSK